jgi:hypothetical protein
MKSINDLETSGLLFEDFASKVASGEFDTDSITAFRVHVHKEMQHLKVMKKVEIENADIDGSYCAAMGVVSPMTVIGATPKRTAKNKARSNVDEDIAIGAHSEDPLLSVKIPRKSGAAPQTDGQTSDLTNMQVNPENPPSVIRKTMPPAFPNAGDAANVAAGETNASQSNYVIKFVSTDITDRDDIPTQKKNPGSGIVLQRISAALGDNSIPDMTKAKMLMRLATHFQHVKPKGLIRASVKRDGVKNFINSEAPDEHTRLFAKAASDLGVIDDVPDFKAMIEGEDLTNPIDYLLNHFNMHHTSKVTKSGSGNKKLKKAKKDLAASEEKCRKLEKQLVSLQKELDTLKGTPNPAMTAAPQSNEQQVSTNDKQDEKDPEGKRQMMDDEKSGDGNEPEAKRQKTGDDGPEDEPCITI